MHTENSIQKKRSPKGNFRRVFVVCTALLVVHCSLLTASLASAASLALDPSVGTFVVGSTFSIPIVLDSDGEPINAIQVDLKFPPEKLQLVSPSTGQSIITLWTSQPSYNNQTGTLSLQGVIPNGITTSRGLVTTLVFRVKNPGDAYVKFLDATQVLKHDGLGSDLLSRQNGGVYRLIMPPPNGPIVASQTHPDNARVYNTNTLFLSWTPEDADIDAYSFMLSGDPVAIPDDIAEGVKTSTIYKAVDDGTSFFHVKGFRAGAWGGTTHFAVNIDVTPPAEFPVDILPSSRTVREQPIVEFITTDAMSGIDHYELKVVPLSARSVDQPLFVEAMSPYVLPPTPRGKYDILVRAYDKAGNYREVAKRLEIASSLFALAGKNGISVYQRLTIPWWLVLLFLILLVFGLVLGAVAAYRRHARAHARLESGQLPIPTAVADAALREKQKQYISVTQVAILLALFVGGALVFRPSAPVFAEMTPVEPPVITTISRTIANDEIFYTGGATGLPNATILVYLQDMTTGSVTTETIAADARGEWFYRSEGFLGAGDYVLWAQTRVGEVMSPPSPQERIAVRRTAFEVGASRVSYEHLYGSAALALLVVVLGLLAFIAHHERHTRRKHARWVREVREAEESVRRGFAVLKRDIEAELATIRKAKLAKELHAEELGREQQLLKDLEWAERYINKEVMDIERENHR